MILLTKNSKIEKPEHRRQKCRDASTILTRKSRNAAAFTFFTFSGHKSPGKICVSPVLIRRSAGKRKIADFGTAARLMRFRTRNCAHRTHPFALSTTSPAVAYRSKHLHISKNDGTTDSFAPPRSTKYCVNANFS